MRHIRIFAQPVGGFHLISLCVKHPSGRFQPFGLWFFCHFRTQFVYRRGLEELVATATAFLLTLLQRFQQCLGRLRSGCEIIDILLLNRVYPSGVFHIHKIDHREFAAFGKIAELLVFKVMIVQFGGKCRPFVIIDHHCKALCRVLTDKRLDNRECLSRTGCADNPCATKRIGDVAPAFAELAFIIEPHRDIHRIFVFHQFCTLLKALILQIESVFQQPFL